MIKNFYTGSNVNQISSTILALLQDFLQHSITFLQTWDAMTEPRKMGSTMSLRSTQQFLKYIVQWSLDMTVQICTPTEIECTNLYTCEIVLNL